MDTTNVGDAPTGESPPAVDPVFSALQAEFNRARAAWVGQADAPYFVSFRVSDTRSRARAASFGSLEAPTENAGRSLDVGARVGSRALDSSHVLREEWGAAPDGQVTWALPLEADEDAMRLAAWAALDEAVSAARERWVRVQANQHVLVEEVDQSGDLTAEAPVVAIEDLPPLADGLEAFDGLVAELSARLGEAPEVEVASAGVRAESQWSWILDSEGSRLRFGRQAVEIRMVVSCTAPDGMELARVRSFYADSLAGLPPAEELRAAADALREELLALRAAPLGQPYAGPVLLEGPAAAVWVHEVVGHRVEGHRQKDEEEGQTFRDQLGRVVLPPHVDIYDDPTLTRYGGRFVYGHYRYDDEGQPARRVDVVKDGVFCGFLMGRSPIAGFPSSNGHGRASPGLPPVARMGCTVLESREPTSNDELRAQLVAEARRQGLSYGLRIDELSGGFTLTGRVLPNAFNLRAERVWKVFVDGRPDELVRGLDTVGTPLVVLSRVMAVGDSPGVFNGHCGAESGDLPNTCASPAVLIGRLEMQRKEKGAGRPPLTRRPAQGGSLGDRLEWAAKAALQLRLPASPHPYHVALDAVDGAEVQLHCTLGSLTREIRHPMRSVGAAVRVGAPEMDNANFGEGWRGGFEWEELPYDDRGGGVDAALWRLVDRCFKQAVQQRARKEAARRHRPAARRPPDFAATPAERHFDPAPPPPDPAELLALARRLSERFRRHRRLLHTGVRAAAESGLRIAVDSDGTRVERAYSQVGLRLEASIVAADGNLVSLDHVAVATHVAGLPPLDDEVDALAARLEALAGARLPEDEYVGPVIFEGDGALSLFRALLAPHLCGTAPLEREDEGYSHDEEPPLLPRRRVLPPGWRVTDDPSLFPDLPSSYIFDDEGVRGRRVELVEDGVVRALLGSRTPGRGAPESTGHGRGLLGELVRAFPSNLGIEAPSSEARDRLRARALEAARPYESDSVLIVRRLSRDGAPTPEELVRLGADGREEPVRGLRFGWLGRRVLREILAAGPMVRRTMLLTPTEDGWRENLGNGIPLTLEVPEILVAELELMPDGRAPARLPSIPSPLLE